jgi:hypothetical protein
LRCFPLMRDREESFGLFDHFRGNCAVGFPLKRRGSL